MPSDSMAHGGAVQKQHATQTSGHINMSIGAFQYVHLGISIYPSGHSDVSHRGIIICPSGHINMSRMHINMSRVHINMSR